MAKEERRLTLPATSPAIQRDYRPEEDVQRLANYFEQRYGNLDNALKTFDRDHEFDLKDFEVALKKWGVKVNSVVNLFDHLDVDWSGTISVEELFLVLELPIQELQEREKRRQREETRRLFEQLARSLRAKFHSLEEAMAKYSPQDPGAPEAGVLSLARFRTLVNGVGVQLEAAQLQRVFYEIDQNRSGGISVGELQKALSDHLVHDSLLELAEALAMKHEGHLEKAFHDLGELQHPENEERFLRLIRHLSVSEVTEDSARLMFSCLKSSPPFTIEEFAQKLQAVYKQSQEEKRLQEEDRRRRERDRRKKLKQALRTNSRHQVVEEVQAWTKKVEGSREVDERDVMHYWGVAARAGRSKTQLKDYVTVLNDCVTETTGETDDLRLLLEQETREAESLKDFLAPAPSPAQGPFLAPAPSPAWSGEVTPITPTTAPNLTPVARGHSAQSQSLYNFAGPSAQSLSSSHFGGRRVDGSRMSKVEKAGRLIQAAAAGDVAGVLSCLTLRVDINAVAWRGSTALMAAARHGRPAVLEALVARRADLLQTDMSGRTAVDHAYKQPRARNWLLSQGGLSKNELEADAEALAKALLQAEAEKSKIVAMRERMPSQEVMQKAALRQAQRRNSLEVSQREHLGSDPQWPPPGPVVFFQSSEPWSPLSSEFSSSGVAPAVRSALATGAPGTGAPKHVRLDCLPQRRPS